MSFIHSNAIQRSRIIIGKMKKGKSMLLHMVIITIITEYAWMCINKQDSDYAWGPKCAKILNMSKF